VFAKDRGDVGVFAVVVRNVGDEPALLQHVGGSREIADPRTKDRVRVNAIAPAGVGTDRIKRMLADRPEAKAALATQQFGLIEPEDIAYAAIFLASDESRMITGHILPVDAGSFAD
jgi:NAD(P)-dependent dehydrogenase (short-subunit alcohol dehydrogenase family)